MDLLVSFYYAQISLSMVNTSNLQGVSYGFFVYVFSILVLLISMTAFRQKNSSQILKFKQ